MTAVASCRPRRSKGALMLSQMGTSIEVARLVGCTGALAGYWQRGHRVPSAAWRRILDQIYSIPEGFWDLPPASGLSPVPSLRQRVFEALAPWPDARERVDAILRRGGIT